MFTYDVIVGTKLGPVHNRTLSYERAELPSTDPSTVYKKLWSAITGVLNSTIDIANKDAINQCLSIIEQTLSNETITTEDLDLVDNCFDVIAYLGLEADAFRRDDMVVPVTEQKSVMAFIVNTKIEDVDDRIAPSLGIATENEALGSINDIVMETFRSKIRINPSLESLIGLSTQIENWEMMSQVGASRDMDVTRLKELLSDMGFKIKIFVS